MKQIVLEYDARSRTARAMLNVLIASGKFFLPRQRRNGVDKAIEEIKNGQCVSCEGYEDFLTKIKS